MLKTTQLWYDWHGANKDLFFLIYGKGLSIFQPYFYIPEFIGEHENIAYFGLLVALMAGLKLIYRVATKNKIDGYFIRSQVAWILSFIVGFLVIAAITGFLKEFAAFPRPYEVFKDTAPLLYNGTMGTTPNSSFPSGHAVFAAFLMVTFWSRVFGLLRFAMFLTLLFVCWYRVVVGYHFPADVFYGAIIGLFATGFVRGIMCKIFRVWR